MPSQSEPIPVAAQAQVQPQRVAPGTILADRYRVVGTLGEGGMGVVYLAEHVHMRKRVAIKVLLPEWTSTPEVIARFEREAVAAGAIGHPHVAAATDFGRLADGAFFLVLEYLEGRTLRTELAAGPVVPARALAIARGIALGVGAAHAKGIVHRDLKPENVMLVARDGDPDFVKVLDFGIARVTGSRAAEGEALTHAGAILGTPEYMAPEQVMGAGIDARTDLYALGVMLFEMLTGDCPFGGETVALLQHHLLTPSPTLPPSVAVPSQVQALVARLLEKNAGARYASAAEVVAVLQECLAEMMPIAPRAVTDRATQDGAGPASALGARASQAVREAFASWRRRPGMAIVVGLGIASVVMTAAAWSNGGPPSSASTVSTTAADSAVPAARAARSSAPSTPITPAAPTAGPASSASSTPTETDATQHAAPSASARKRHTGPGGIYIPPPNQWFK